MGLFSHDDTYDKIEWLITNKEKEAINLQVELNQIDKDIMQLILGCSDLGIDLESFKMKRVEKFVKLDTIQGFIKELKSL